MGYVDSKYITSEGCLGQMPKDFAALAAVSRSVYYDFSNALNVALLNLSPEHIILQSWIQLIVSSDWEIHRERF